MKINSSDIIYSEHGEDECFEYKVDGGRVPEGEAVGFLINYGKDFVLFNDIKYSEHDHTYWDNYELENDVNRIVLP
jgi:hypothetical protein